MHRKRREVKNEICYVLWNSTYRKNYRQVRLTIVGGGASTTDPLYFCGHFSAFHTGTPVRRSCSRLWMISTMWNSFNQLHKQTGMLLSCFKEEIFPLFICHSFNPSLKNGLINIKPNVPNSSRLLVQRSTV